MNSLIRSLPFVALSLAAASASAHTSYTNRNFGTLVNGSTSTIATQTVTGNYGWADAADLALDFGNADAKDNLYLGDSHAARAFRLHLDSTLTLSFTASARAAGTGGAGLLPGLSVYQGLAAVSPYTAPQTSADYDSSAASLAWRSSWAQAIDASYTHTATGGSWNALGDWAAGGDGDPVGVASALSFLRYVGSAYDSDTNGVATLTLTLDAGDYSIFVGGSDIASKGNGMTYGLTMSVSAVPEPQAALLMLLGLPLLALRRRTTRD